MNRRAFLEACAALALGVHYPIYRTALPAVTAEQKSHANFCWFVSGAFKAGVPPPYGTIPAWWFLHYCRRPEDVAGREIEMREPWKKPE